MSGAGFTLRDVIHRFGHAFLDQRGAKLTPAQDRLLSTLGRCHTAALGGHLYRCDTCGFERTAYNSCRNRHCPSCLADKSAKWLADREAELLPVPYFHVVFTMPAEVAALALGNKQVVYNILFRAASETLTQVAANPKHLGATVGFLAVLHTWTQKLLYHPHIHCVVPGGGISIDGTQWVKSKGDFFLPVRVLSRLFRGKFLAYLAEAARARTLRFAGATAPLATLAGFAAFLREQRAKEWVVYAKPPFGSPKQVLKYLARYTHKVAICDRRILDIQDDGVSFSYRDNASNSRGIMTLSGVEFLRRFLLHVLPTDFVRIRYYGLLANRSRAKNIARCKELLGVKPGEAGSATSGAPTQTEPAENGVHPCLYCTTGRLRCVAIHPRIPALEMNRWEPIARDTS